MEAPATSTTTQNTRTSKTEAQPKAEPNAKSSKTSKVGETPAKPADGKGDEPPKKGKRGKAPKDKNTRECLGWEEAREGEWRIEAEFAGYQKWRYRFGPCTEWWDRYEKWIDSGTTRGVMRKASLRAFEWARYQRGIEIAPVGECCTRRRTSIRDWFVEPLENYCCRPCPWPKITSGEIGWLGQHKSCQLEIYPNDFMKKPPLPSFDRRPSSFPPGTW